MLTLFHAPQSRSSRFIWLLEELGQPLEIEYVGIRRGDGSGGEDVRNPHPHGKTPALLHDGVLITESVAIALYLCDAFPKAGLAPPIGDPSRGPFLTWMAYYAGVVEPAMVAAFTKWETPPGVTGWVPFEVAEARIAEGLAQGPWLLGDRFSAADILYGSLLQWAARMFPERPQYEAYKARIAERPALQRAMAKDAAPA